MVAARDKIAVAWLFFVAARRRRRLLFQIATSLRFNISHDVFVNILV